MVHRRFTKKENDDKSEMAPVNGFKQTSEEEMDALRSAREALMEKVSKKMGELLLKGYTMLDAYCDQCGGILMESRSGVRDCVTCELRNEEKKAALPLSAQILAQIPLDVDDVPVGVATSEVSTRQTVRLPAPPSSSAPRVLSHKTTTEVPSKARAGNDCFDEVLRGVEAKLRWATAALQSTDRPQEVRELFALISDGLHILHNFR